MCKTPLISQRKYIKDDTGRPHSYKSRSSANKTLPPIPVRISSKVSFKSPPLIQFASHGTYCGANNVESHSKYSHKTAMKHVDATIIRNRFHFENDGESEKK